MAETSSAPSKRERKRLRQAEARRAARRDQQRRTIATTLVAAALFAVVAVLFSNLLGPDSGAGPIQPSAPRDVSVAGPPRSSLLGVGARIPAFSAPGFRMTADAAPKVERQPVDWSSYEGSPAVVSVWASWCPHCQAELPILSREVAATPGAKLVTIVTSIGAHPGPTPSGYLADHHLTFPVAIDDAQGTLAAAFGVQAFPTLYFVDSNGVVRYAAEGELPEDELRAHLAALS